MKRFAFTRRHGAMLAMLFGFFLTTPALLPAQAPVKIRKYNFVVDMSTTPAKFTMEGTASHLGRFAARGELTLRPGVEPGTVEGSGPVVFRAANGDLLVGNMTWGLSAPAADSYGTAHIHFRWSDSVTFHDRTVATNTGRFVEDRPPGLVVVSIVYWVLRTILGSGPF